MIPKCPGFVISCFLSSSTFVFFLYLPSLIFSACPASASLAVSSCSCFIVASEASISPLSALTCGDEKSLVSTLYLHKEPRSSGGSSGSGLEEVRADLRFERKKGWGRDQAYNALAVAGQLVVPVTFTLPLLLQLFLLDFFDCVGAAFFVCSCVLRSC